MKKIFFSICMMPLLAFAQAVLPTSWNFTTPGISTPPDGWITGLGTNGNLTYSGNGFSVGGDGLSCRLDGNGEFLTVWFNDKPGNLSYYIRGTGFGTNPPFAGSFKIQESVDGATWTDIRNFTAMTTTLTRYSESLNAASRYVRFFYADKQAGTNVALDSVLILNAPPPATGIMVKQNTTTLINGNTFAYGNAASKLFTIQNFGVSANLKVDSIVVTGTNAADFSIGAFDSITPFNNGTDTFSVYFNPSANGSRYATLKIYSTDSERNPFDVNLYGVGGQFATEPVNQVGAVNISNVRTHALNVSFSRATGAEKYILLRKTGASITEAPLDGTTYQRGDYIGNAQVAYIGDDTTLLRPNYILANTAYSFAAFTFNGPAGFENYNTTSAPSATTTTQNGTPGNYYSNVDTNSFNFVTALGNRVRTPHDTIFYSNYAPTMVNSYLARDTSMGRKVVDCVYTGLKHIYQDPFIWWTGNNSGTLTREHTFAQSWMPSNGGAGSGWPNINGREVLEFNDLHNLFPADQTNANAVRSNNPFGVVVNATSTSPTGQGKLGTNTNGITVYEPRDEQKGDLARALFYMLVRYNGERNNQWRLPAGQDINVLLQWHQQDPPSAIEIARNEYIFSIQKNRNPFIDNPTWVNRINFATMAYVPDPSAVMIDLTAPNGGQTFMVGSAQNITWNQQNIDTVVIEYRAAATAPWVMITDTVPGVRGTYSWTIPNTVTTTASVRIKNKTNNAIADSSTNTFRIDVPRSVNITYPTAGETWVRGKFYTVTWNQQNLDTLVVQIQTTAGPYTTLGRVAAANGAYTFNLTTAPTTTARVRVIDPTNLTLNSVSGTFNIVQSTINITTVPDSTWEGNQTKTISWTESYADTVEVKYIGLNTQTSTVDTITVANNITADSFNLTLPNVYSNITVWVKEASVLKNPTYTAFDTLNFNIRLVNSLSKNDLINQLVNVYPVPSNGVVFVNMPSNIQLNKIEIFDVTGKLVDTTASTQLNINHKGLYIIKVTTQQGVATKRIVIE
jgi:hypothetical protein